MIARRIQFIFVRFENGYNIIASFPALGKCALSHIKLEVFCHRVQMFNHCWVYCIWSWSWISEVVMNNRFEFNNPERMFKFIIISLWRFKVYWITLVTSLSRVGLRFYAVDAAFICLIDLSTSSFHQGTFSFRFVMRPKEREIAWDAASTILDVKSCTFSSIQGCWTCTWSTVRLRKRFQFASFIYHRL